MTFINKYIYQNKNKITLLSIILIIIGYIARFIFGNTIVYNTSFIIASVFGLIPIALQAFQAIKVRVISIDILVTIAVIGAFIIGEYEESAIVTFLFLFGAYLEAKTLNKTRAAIKELTILLPETVLKEDIDGNFIEVDITDVKEADILLIKTGFRIPVDGTIISGEGFLNEASITGESVFLNKEVGDKVYAGTILEDGTIKIITNNVGEETIFGKIIELVEEAEDSKSVAERIIDKFSKWYTPVVLLIGIVVGLVMHFGFNSNNALTTAVTILVLGCPGALVIGVPVSNVASIGNGAREGILFKGSEVINDFSKTDVIVFDKTGTLTTGSPSVHDVRFYNNKIDQAKSYLLSIEKESDHPLAKAIVNYLSSDNNNNLEVLDTKVIRGGGVVGTINNNEVIVGNYKLIKEYGININNEMKTTIEEFEEAGNSIVITAINKSVHIIMGIKDEIRIGIKNDLARIRKMGVNNLVLLSGDNQGTVDLVSKELGFTTAIGNMLPSDKSNYIKQLQEKGNIVAFVGDGVNDAPSLVVANVGIALGSGTDVAIETSDVVLMKSDLSKIPYALELTKKTINNMWQNIFIAVGVVIILLISLIGFDWLTMSIGMLVHQASILVVIFNGMRLLKHNPKN